MTLKEISLFFGIKEDDFLRFNKEDQENLVEEYVFDLKKLIISKIPVKKLLESRIKKLDKLQEICHFLELRLFDVYEVNLNEVSFESDSVLSVFNSYSSKQVEIKKGLMNSNSPLVVRNLSISLIELEKKYASHWFLDNSWDSETKISQLQDSMLILTAIKEFNLKKEKTFTELKNNLNNAPIILVNELKRLSLLFKDF
jgi:hypothetical protein